LLGIPQVEAHLFQTFAVVTYDYLWFIKNKAHHEGLIPNDLVISYTINKNVLEHHFTWKIKLCISCELWQSPPAPFFKINYDTSIRDTFSAQAAVCRDSKGCIIKCFSLISSPYTLIFGEALAARLTKLLGLI